MVAAPGTRQRLVHPAQAAAFPRRLERLGERRTRCHCAHRVSTTVKHITNFQVLSQLDFLRNFSTAHPLGSADMKETQPRRLNPSLLGSFDISFFSHRTYVQHCRKKKILTQQKANFRHRRQHIFQILLRVFLPSFHKIDGFHTM